MCASYLNLLNLSYQQQTKREDILMYTVASKRDFETITKDKYFTPLINMIKEINYNPILLTDGYYVTVKLAAVAADLLAQHYMQNICTAFRWESCMYCEVGGSQNLKTFHLTKNNQAPIKELPVDHLFNRLEVQGRVFAPDNFHIFNEGIIEWICELILSKVSVSIRERIANDMKNKFKKFFKNGFPYNIEKANVHGTGIQKYDFFAMLPVLIKFDDIDRNCPEYKLLILSRRSCVSETHVIHTIP